jgi:tripartite-type tricarboxylate transporter receptor subunit TctC
VNIRVTCAALLAATSFSSTAQTYPDRPIRMIVAVPAGGTADVVGRMAQPALVKSLGQPVVMDNRGGAGGMIGAETAAKSAPDGYTLFFCAPGPLTVLPHLQKQVAYDPLKDFAPVGLVAVGPFLLVNFAGDPYRTIKDMIAQAKANPGKIKYASAGNGSSNHLATEWLKNMAGVDITHVPYRGAPQGVTDVMGGHVSFTFSSIPPALPHIKTGRLHVLGISSLKRSPLLPDVPTISEAGIPGYEWATWLGLLAPAKTPRPILQKVHASMMSAFNTPEMKSQLEVMGYEIILNSPDEFQNYIRAEWQKNAKVVKLSGAKVD